MEYWKIFLDTPERRRTFWTTLKDGLFALVGNSVNRLRALLFARLSYWNSRLFPRRPVLWNKTLPVSASIELTTYCNLRCPECPSGRRELFRPEGMISLQDFRKWVKSLAPTVHYLHLYVLGEPFLHPKLPELIRIARMHGLYVALSTNGHFLRPDWSEAVIRAGLNRMIVSVDGYSQGVYQQYRKGGDVQKVRKGVETFLQIRRRLRAVRPWVLIQMLGFRFNLPEAPLLLRWAHRVGADGFILKSARVDFSVRSHWIPSIPGLNRYLRRNTGHSSCWRLWSTLVLTWDGTLLPCCYDSHGWMLRERWVPQEVARSFLSAKFSRLRLQVLFSRQKLLLCRNCPER